MYRILYTLCVNVQYVSFRMRGLFVVGKNPSRVRLQWDFVVVLTWPAVSPGKQEQ